ncbi:OsmC family protein [Paracraurococcus ruber]|uniref:Osmotically inducible protein OsmC n=1 Tax=Paracraurococcus ruber TaxID=77675 RepID=A0ABS1CQE5_9PROT|nr:OsmC family protein [Paracraurococcus ruber]MBK1656655.1 osmotically inducible protein OsmC [Paracraurococcus ruber]TDG33724.1 OsmC family peroxiredoxin [Paracraurococcus ruber]
MNTLDDYLALKRPAYQAIKARARAPGYEPGTLRAVVTVEGRSGIRRIRLRDHQVITDSPPDFVGYDLGPSSPEIALGALGSCLAHSWLIQAAVHGLPLQSVEVEVTGRIDARAGEPGHEDIRPEPQGIGFTVRLTTAASGAEITVVEAAVDRASPILNLLRRPQAIAARVEGVLPGGDPRNA